MSNKDTYLKLLETIKLTQDKELIINNLLNGKKYAVFTISPDLNETTTQYNYKVCTIKYSHRVRTTPDFNLNEIYLPYIYTNDYSNDLHKYVAKYKELNSCCIFEESFHHIYIDTNRSLHNLLKANLDSQTHKLPIKKTDKKDFFSESYYKILNYIKETTELYHPDHITDKRPYILNFDLKKKRFSFKQVDPKNFKDYDSLFLLENRNKIKDYLIFNTDGSIDIQNTIHKIDLFYKLKNF